MSCQPKILFAKSRRKSEYLGHIMINNSKYRIVQIVGQRMDEDKGASSEDEELCDWPTGVVICTIKFATSGIGQTNRRSRRSINRHNSRRAVFLCLMRNKFKLHSLVLADFRRILTIKTIQIQSTESPQEFESWYENSF